MTAHTSETTPKQQRLPSLERAAGCSPVLSNIKRKKLSIVLPPLPVAAHGHEPQHVLAEVSTNPRRRFQRRNSKCPSMFYQMLSPANLLELQRDAAEDDESPMGSPQAPDRKEGERGWSDNKPYMRGQHDVLRAFRPAPWIEAEKRLTSSRTHQKNATLSILNEALHLSSAHLRAPAAGHRTE